MQQFQEGITRAKAWMQKVIEVKKIRPHLQPDTENMFHKKKRKPISQTVKIPYKLLQQCLQEYKNLPLYDEDVDRIYKPMFDESAQLLDKIPNIIQRISKTRGKFYIYKLLLLSFLLLW